MKEILRRIKRQYKRTLIPYHKAPIIGMFLMVLIATGCGPTINTHISKSYTAIDPQVEVAVFDLGVPVPQSAGIIGYVQIGESGFTTKCRFEYVVEVAKMEARKIGGNAIQIVEHKRPDILSSCHRIHAKILRVPA